MFGYDGSSNYEFSGLYGFGLDVPYADKQGSTKLAHATDASYCSGDGNALALQQMLYDLGFDPGKIDGVMGQATRNAVKAFAAAQGIDAGAFISQGAICQAIMTAWQNKQAPAAPPSTGPAAPGPTSPSAQMALAQKLRLSQAALMRPTGSSVSTVSGQGPVDKARAWWGGQSTATKVGIGVGAVAIIGLLAYAVAGGKSSSSATPNPRRKGRKSRRRASRVKTCRPRPPKGYPKRRGAYALPECFLYRLDTRKNVRAAASRFGKHKRRYPKRERAIISRRLDAAKRRFHIGEYR